VENLALVVLFYKCVQDPDAYFLGVFFEEVPYLASDIVDFESAG